MKITIDNLQSKDSLSEIDSSTGDEIVGGGLIDAYINNFSASNNSFAQTTGRVFGSGFNLSGNIIAETETGQGFSRSSTFVSITSG